MEIRAPLSSRRTPAQDPVLGRHQRRRGRFKTRRPRRSRRSSRRRSTPTHRRRRERRHWVNRTVYVRSDWLAGSDVRIPDEHVHVPHGIGSTSGEVSGTPATAFASCTYSVTAVNGAGNADAGPFTITMAAAPPAGGGGGGRPVRCGRRCLNVVLAPLRDRRPPSSETTSARLHSKPRWCFLTGGDRSC